MKDGTGKKRFAFATIPTIIFMISVSVLASVLGAAAFSRSLYSSNQTSEADYWYVGAVSGDNAYFQNNGVRSEIQVVPQSVSSFLGFWVAETFNSGLWAQVGYYMFASSIPLAFFQVWNLTSRSEIDSGTTPVSAGYHLFSMSLSKGSTFEFSVDQYVIGFYDLQANASSPGDQIYALSEEGYCSSPFRFEPVSFSAIQVLKGSMWVNVTSARSYGNAWGILGEAQDQTIGSAQFIVGGNLSSPAEGTPLW